MRADAHYVELLTSERPGAREHQLDPHVIEFTAPAEGASAPLVESIRTHGVLQALLVQHRNGRYRLLAGRHRLRAAIEVGLRRVPCMVYDVEDREAEALQSAAGLRMVRQNDPAAASARPLSAEAPAAVAQSLGTVAICANLISEGGTPLSRTVAADLIRAEVWRSTCLLNAARAIGRRAPVGSAPVPARRLSDRVLTEFQPEQRLRGYEIELSYDLPEGTVVLGDEALLTAAVSNAVLATLPFVEGVPSARITLRVSAASNSQLTFDVRQSVVGAPDTWLSRAFDESWIDRPGGALAALSLACVRAAAEAHQGRASTSAAGRGTSIVLSVPARIPARAH
jgi:signal transduction histidine kinase